MNVGIYTSILIRIAVRTRDPRALENCLRITSFRLRRRFAAELEIANAFGNADESVKVAAQIFRLTETGKQFARQARNN